jgi:hypothetical protein
MKNFILIFFTFLTSLSLIAQGTNEDSTFKNSSDLKINNTSVVYNQELEQLIFTIETKGMAGNSVPKAIGKMDGAPVLGYVFPTTLKSTDVGFGEAEGIVALALTSHPDFDDTPLWDENADQNYVNDGVIWHPHWVVLTKDSRVAGGLAVKQFDPKNENVTLPPTNPGMPMYMDSPGFSVITKGNSIKVIVPAYLIKHKTQFNFDAVTAYMEVNATNSKYPMLGVYSVYSVASGNLSSPYTVKIK